MFTRNDESPKNSFDRMIMNGLTQCSESVVEGHDHDVPRREDVSRLRLRSSGTEVAGMDVHDDGIDFLVEL